MAVNESLLKDRASRVAAVQRKAEELKRTYDQSRIESSSRLDELLDLDRAREKAARGELTGERDAVRGSLSALDRAMEEGKRFGNDMQELIEELTKELEALGRKVMTSKDYTSPERVKRFFSERWANKSRLNRIKAQQIDGSMRTVLAYAAGTVESLESQIQKNTELYQALTAKTRGITDKLRDNHPKFEEWREKVKDLEVRKKDMERKIKIAADSERPALQSELTTLQLELDQAKINETSYFEICRNAEEAIDIVRFHAEGFKQAIDALVKSKIKTSEKIDNLTEVFTGIYQIMETSLEMKGFSRIDQTLNFATDKTTEAMSSQLEGILDEVQARDEQPLIDEDKMRRYLEHMHDLIDRFGAAVKKQQEKYATKGKTAD